VIRSDSETTIAIDGLDTSAIAAKIKAELAKPQAPDSIEEIVLTESGSTGIARAPVTDVLSAMDITAPDIIARTLQPLWMFGIYTDASGRKSLFAIVETNFFQNAFAGMLQWESTMPYDLQPYLYQQATSTPINGQFSDHIVKNADVREYITTDSQTAFLYSFVNNSTLVVAGNEAALSEIQSRLEQQAFVR
jgi:hypothetical protein